MRICVHGGSGDGDCLFYSMIDVATEILRSPLLKRQLSPEIDSLRNDQDVNKLGITVSFHVRVVMAMCIKRMLCFSLLGVNKFAAAFGLVCGALQWWYHGRRACDVRRLMAMGSAGDEAAADGVGEPDGRRAVFLQRRQQLPLGGGWMGGRGGPPRAGLALPAPGLARPCCHGRRAPPCATPSPSSAHFSLSAVGAWRVTCHGSRVACHVSRPCVSQARMQHVEVTQERRACCGQQRGEINDRDESRGPSSKLEPPGEGEGEGRPCC